MGCSQNLQKLPNQFVAVSEGQFFQILRSTSFVMNVLRKQTLVDFQNSMGFLPPKTVQFVQIELKFKKPNSFNISTQILSTEIFKFTDP